VRLQVGLPRTQDRTLWNGTARHGTARHGMAYAPTSARTEHAHKIHEAPDRGRREHPDIVFRMCMCMRCMCTRECGEGPSAASVPVSITSQPFSNSSDGMIAYRMSANPPPSVSARTC
jgi:hypothetical protein